jgi:cytidyltransferase-like protein
MADRLPHEEDEFHTSDLPLPPLGPEPLLLKRTQVDGLYHLLQAVVSALDQCFVSTPAAISQDRPCDTHKLSYIITGGSLLGAVRQHSILFTDDDVDIAIVECTGYCLQSVRDHLPVLLGPEYRYTVNAWEGSDRIRWNQCSNVFVDVFCIREYRTVDDLHSVLSVKKNGQTQTNEYVNSVMASISTAANFTGSSSLFPCWHFDRRKAIELWPREVYRQLELFPVQRNYQMGPVIKMSGPHLPVTLLQRAFGADCFTHYYQSTGHDQKCNVATETVSTSNIDDCSNGTLRPHLRIGGTWEGTAAHPLLPEHYIPMQPTLRSQRRLTRHNQEQLRAYLQQQSQFEDEVIRHHQKDESASLVASSDITSSVVLSNCTVRPRRTIYMDGFFDLFHTGHVRAIQQCVELGDRILIGITGDRDAAQYKRPPVMKQADRVAVVAAMKYVDHVICPCPLVVTEEFLDQHTIDLVVHGFADETDAERQRSFFRIPEERGKFQRIDYYFDLSTSDVIRKIQSLSVQNGNYHQDEAVLSPPSSAKSNWFGTTLIAATEAAVDIPYDPFPLRLRLAIQPHIAKARAKQSSALEAICKELEMSKTHLLDQVQASSPLATEGAFSYDPDCYPLRETLLRCGGFPENFDLTELHIRPKNKVELLRALTKNYWDFQHLYDRFVREICVPRFVASVTSEASQEVYYQAFPCIRVVQPGEFSIGPHSDITYGHHAGSINIYLPLTCIEGSAALFLESRFGSEDWHPILGSYGTAKHFAGASCLHWTTNNTAGYTRVSLDFRLVAGTIFHALPNSGVSYRQGFYCCCRLQLDGTWKCVDGEIPAPDKRSGFPWTVNDWDKWE